MAYYKGKLKRNGTGASQHETAVASNQDFDSRQLQLLQTQHLHFAFFITEIKVLVSEYLLSQKHTYILQGL
jgi:hypothetical protein